MNYDHKFIEKKWQERESFEVEEDSTKPKFYCLDMFPYPSGVGLHVGHPRGYIASDIVSRYKRMQGFNVLHPMGWDTFGLPAENYAIKTGVHPKITVAENVAKFKAQLKQLGLSYNWSREINTTDPNYYKWTQWIFLRMFEQGLAYEQVLPINWCPSCKTGLANEEVVAGKCERCGANVTKKNIRQWVLKITKYADRLLEDLDLLDWPEKIKEMQRNWIGKSYGADVLFKLNNGKEVKVFTTRPDTLFGVTLLILSPEHPLVESVLSELDNKQDVINYLEETKNKSDIERMEEKTGVPLSGLFAINPVNGKQIPVWIANYILSSYGYGAIMSVPAHDQRDYEFAKKYDLEIIEVVSGGELPYTGEGNLVNSGSFNGIKSSEAKDKIIKEFDSVTKSINYKLRDWVFSRQRYWGEPIPLIHCEKCGIVPEENIPLELPEVENYQPTGTGESPLAAIKEWVNVKCPKCGGDAKRETNTMPQWAGSCWYYLRFIDPDNDNALVDPQKEKYFQPVDLYIGGSEHAVLHLLYARFWHKFLYDIGVVSTKEPFLKLKNQGLIMAYDGQKMSKSKGNTVSPDEMIEKYGADSLRLYEMFLGPFEESVAWNDNGLIGTRRFLEKVWSINLVEGNIEDRLLHQTIKKVTKDIEEFKFNTAISSMMILINEWVKTGTSRENFDLFLKLLYPFAPHISQELMKDSDLSWPQFSEFLVEDDVTTIAIQVNGKFRDSVQLAKGLNQQEVENIVLEREKVKKWVSGSIKKVVFIPDKLINILV
ncbi:MAG: Leucine--tRNA ligase [Parcubacteria group bacterium ADurb.Bin247]|nr:MAG: Leucine--tRNA ligase [Parcubacteria group bacterium ADurb.Bin247]